MRLVLGRFNRCNIEKACYPVADPDIIYMRHLFSSNAKLPEETVLDPVGLVQTWTQTDLLLILAFALVTKIAKDGFNVFTFANVPLSLDVTFTLEVACIVVVRGAEVDPVVGAGHIEGLRPLPRVLEKLVKQIVTAAAAVQLLGLILHRQRTVQAKLAFKYL